MSKSLSVPEQIRLKFAEADGLMIEQEKNMEMKMREREEKLGNSERKCEELAMNIAEKEVKIERLWGEIWVKEKKVKVKGGECEELKRAEQELRVKKAQSDEDARVYKDRVHDLEVKAQSVMNMEIEMGKVVKERDSLNKKIVEKDEKIERLWEKVLDFEEKLEWKGRECEELKRKEIGVEQVVQELRVSKMESDKEAQLYKSRVHDLEVKISKVKANLAGLVGSMNDSAAADTNLRDDFVENREVVMFDPPQGLSNTAGILLVN